VDGCREPRQTNFLPARIGYVERLEAAAHIVAIGVCTFNSEKATSSTSVTDLPKPRQPLGLQQSERRGFSAPTIKKTAARRQGWICRAESNAFRIDRSAEVCADDVIARVTLIAAIHESRDISLACNDLSLSGRVWP
jgi:hypothetical protein